MRSSNIGSWLNGNANTLALNAQGTLSGLQQQLGNNYQQNANMMTTANQNMQYATYTAANSVLNNQK